MIKVGIVGATGYTGIELIRLLDQHPHVKITKLFGQKTSGTFIGDNYPHLASKYQILLETFDPNADSEVDVLFLGVPHATSHAYMKTLLKQNHKIIDLSPDFRLNKTETYEKYYKVQHQSPDLLSQAVLGFPEIYREKIAKAQLVANPGCYATSVILGLYPLAKEGFLKNTVTVDAKSGISGAGKALKETSLFCEVNECISSYLTGEHRHTGEMEQELNTKVLFSPHLTPMNRGILSCMYVDNQDKLNKEKIVDIYKKYYKNEPFVQIMENLEMPSTKYVRGTNSIMISFKFLEEYNKFVVFSAIDNLIKGASGQAIQCMNIMCGFEETSGLNQIAHYL